jgi:mono/diheme cytochrome c family protein
MGKTILPRAALTAAVVAAATLLSACGSSGSDADVVAGKQLFVKKCGACHTLNRADTKGTQGPDLDDAFQQSQKDGFGESAIRGVVYQQILHPAKDGVMPSGLVTGDHAHDVAAYVAAVVAKSGKDSGLLATAVKSGGSATATEKAGVLDIPADPNGQLAFAAAKAVGQAGPVTIAMKNTSGVAHDIVIDGLGQGETTPNGTSSFKATLQAGKTYTYYCSLPGHREAGMQGTLTVK